MTSQFFSKTSCEVFDDADRKLPSLVVGMAVRAFDTVGVYGAGSAQASGAYADLRAVTDLCQSQQGIDAGVDVAASGKQREMPGDFVVAMEHYRDTVARTGSSSIESCIAFAAVMWVAPQWFKDETNAFLDEQGLGQQMRSPRCTSTRFPRPTSHIGNWRLQALSSAGLLLSDAVT